VSIYFGDDEKLLEIGARTIKPDGTISEIKPEEFYTILPDYASGATISGSKLVKFSFPNISKNCILEYKYKKIVYSIFSGDYWQIQNYEMPTLKNQYLLMVPKILSTSKVYGGAELNWNAKPYNYNFDAKPVPVMTAGNKTYTEWIITDIPEFKPEAKMPPIRSCITHVRFMRNDIKDWDELSEIFSSYIFPQLIISEKVKSLADELTKGKTSEMEKLLSIHNYVRKIRYLAISLGIGGFQPHTPDEVIEKGYGDCKDKAVLLIALLSAVNITAEPVLVLTRDKGEVDPKFPSQVFNHMITKVVVDNNKFFVDPTSRFTKIKELPWSDEDVFAFILKPIGAAKIEKTPSSKSSDNIMNVDVVLNIADDMKVNVDFKVTSTGVQENQSRYGFYDRKEKDIQDAVKSNFGGDLKDITVEDIKYSDPDDLNIPFEFKFNYTTSELIQKIGEDYIIDLSDFLSTPGARWLSEKERKFDIWNSYAYEDNFNIVINYNNKKLKVKSLPSNKTIPDKDYNYKRINFQKSDSQIETKQTFISNSTLIKKERYGELKKFFADVTNADKEKIVFEVVK